MLSATTVETLVQSVLQSHEASSQHSHVSGVLQAKLSKLANLVETKLECAESLGEHFDDGQLGAILQNVQQKAQEFASHVEGCGDAQTPQLSESFVQEQSLQQSEAFTFDGGYESNPVTKLTQLYVQIVEHVTEEIESISSGSLSSEELLAGILVKVGEHFDIDFGPGDGTGCGTAALDAIIPDRIGNIDLTCSCMTHDDAYGDLDQTKLEADVGLFHDVYAAAQDGGAGKAESFLLAGIYFGSVYYFGGPAWLAAQQEAMMA